MKFKHMNPDAVCELLIHLAEHEDFKSIKALGLKEDDVRDVLHEMAAQLKLAITAETSGTRPDYSQLNLSTEAMSLLSSLSPREEMLLFKSFRLV